MPYYDNFWHIDAMRISHRLNFVL